MLHHPWKYCFLTPPPLSTLVFVVGTVAPGSQLPASSVRGIGARRGDGTVTLVGWGVDVLVALPPQAAYHGRWCWMGSWRWCRRGKGRRRSEETRLPDLMARFAGAAEMDMAVPSARLDSFVVKWRRPGAFG